MVVYFHRNRKTGIVFYVGIGQKRRAHESGGRNIIWNNYVKKHGKPVVEIVKSELKKEDAYYWELFYVALYKRKKDGGTLVNITAGGEDNPMHHEHIRSKVALSNTGKKASAETKLKQSLLKKGKPSNQPVGYKHSPEVIAKLKIINKEIVNRPEVKAKLRLSMLGNRNISRHKKVSMIDINTGNTLNIFDCITDALRFLNVDLKSGNITSVCVGRRNNAYGYKWSYPN